VGSGLQQMTNLGLVAGHPGTTVTITSSDPSVLLVSPNASTPGSASINLVVAAGNATPNFFVQGVEGKTGTATVTATAPGYTNGTGLMTVVQPALDIIDLNTTPNSAAADDPFLVRVGLPGTGNTQLAAGQAVRAGGVALTVTLNSGNSAVGQLVTTASTGATVTMQIVPGQSASAGSVSSGGVAFDPLTAGSTVVSATITGFIQTAAGARTVTVN
jgi:hypothetical protein